MPTSGQAGAARDELAEQLGVVVVDAEDALVERLLGGPDAGGDGAGEGAAGGLGAGRWAWRRARLYPVTGPRAAGTTWHGSRNALLERARNRGVNPIVYWLVRGVLQPFFHLYFRMSRIGREHIPQRAR